MVLLLRRSPVTLFHLLYSPSDYTKGKHNAGLIDEDEWSCKEPRKVDTIHLTKGIKANEIHENPEKYVLHLDYFRFKNLLDIDPPENSVYVRAQCEPFDPRMEISEIRMINWLRHFRINEHNDFRPFQIHASAVCSLNKNASTFGVNVPSQPCQKISDP